MKKMIGMTGGNQLIHSVNSSLMRVRNMSRKESRPLPRSPQEWLKEIKLAIADAAEAKPFGRLVGDPITDADLFHLAPLVCLKFRGSQLSAAETKRVTEAALANYVVNSDPDGIDHGLKQKPMLAFALCYVSAHLALDLVDEQQADRILNYCEENLDGE